METKFQCSFCENRFVHESRYLKHRCRAMIRDEELRTPHGQAAFQFYQQWMKAHRRKAPKAEAFLTSKFYKAFMSFAKFVHKTNIADVDTYIMLMSSDDITPTMWTLDAAYTRYIEFMDRRTPPDRHAEITIDTLFNLAADYDVDVEDVFTKVTPAEVIQLLRQRRLSPWVVLKSGKFREFFTNKCSNEEQLMMQSIIRPANWTQKFEKHPDVVDRMKRYVAELSI